MSDRIIDVHDLATVLLRERLLTESRFKHARLREVNDGSRPLNCLPENVVLPELAAIPPEAPHNAYFLLSDGEEKDSDPAIELADFLHRDFVSAEELPPKDIETAFWKCKHHDSGYLLAHTMQIVVDSLPAGNRLRLRTSQGHSIICNPSSFNIAELTLFPKSATYICHYKPRPDLGPSKIDLSHFVVGSDQGDIRWLYLVFGDDDVKDTDISKDRRVMLDLASTMLGMRGLGGEIFAMERLEDYHDHVLSTAALEGEELNLVGRIAPGSSGDLRNLRQGLEAQRLADKVLRRIERIGNGEETFCSYCGKLAPKLQCSTCRSVHYCGSICQKSSWKYHKKWCKDKNTSAR